MLPAFVGGQLYDASTHRQCPVCLEEVAKSNAKYTVCGHLICSVCSTRIGNICPVCRVDLKRAALAISNDISPPSPVSQPVPRPLARQLHDIIFIDLHDIDVNLLNFELQPCLTSIRIRYGSLRFAINFPDMTYHGLLRGSSTAMRLSFEEDMHYQKLREIDQYIYDHSRSFWEALEISSYYEDETYYFPDPDRDQDRAPYVSPIINNYIIVSKPYDQPVRDLSRMARISMQVKWNKIVRSSPQTVSTPIVASKIL